MRKHTSRAQQPGLCPDGLPNRAMRRQHPSMAGQATFRAFSNWYWVASNLLPGYVAPRETFETEQKIAEAA